MDSCRRQTRWLCIRTAEDRTVAAFQERFHIISSQHVCMVLSSHLQSQVIIISNPTVSNYIIFDIF